MVARIGVNERIARGVSVSDGFSGGRVFHAWEVSYALSEFLPIYVLDCVAPCCAALTVEPQHQVISRGEGYATGSHENFARSRC